MRQLSTSDHMTQKLIITGHRMAFNTEHSSYCIVSLKGPDMTNVKQYKRETYRPNLCTK